MQPAPDQHDRFQASGGTSVSGRSTSVLSLSPLERSALPAVLFPSKREAYHGDQKITRKCDRHWYGFPAERQQFVDVAKWGRENQKQSYS